MSGDKGAEFLLNNLAGDVIAFINVSRRVLYGAFVPMRYCLLRFSTEIIGLLIIVMDLKDIYFSSSYVL